MADERRVPGACDDFDTRATDQTVPVTDQIDGKCWLTSDRFGFELIKRGGTYFDPALISDFKAGLKYVPKVCDNFDLRAND